jgi:predicted aconitase
VAFVGCPHCSYTQLQAWTEILEDALRKVGKERVAITTLFSTAPDVLDKFKKTEAYGRLMATGAQLTFICPLMYLSSPLSAAKRVITNSNKLRTYTASRYVDDVDLIRVVVEGGLL